MRESSSGAGAEPRTQLEDLTASLYPWLVGGASCPLPKNPTSALNPVALSEMTYYVWSGTLNPTH